MQKFPRRWDKKTCIEYLQRKLILNSIAYYEMNISKLSDKDFDELCKQLVDMQSEISAEHLMETQYGYVFYDFDGSTGFNLYHRLNEYDRKYLWHIADLVCGYTIINQVKNKVKKGKLF